MKEKKYKVATDEKKYGGKQKWQLKIMKKIEAWAEVRGLLLVENENVELDLIDKERIVGEEDGFIYVDIDNDYDDSEDEPDRLKGMLTELLAELEEDEGDSGTEEESGKMDLATARKIAESRGIKFNDAPNKRNPIVYIDDRKEGD